MPRMTVLTTALIATSLLTGAPVAYAQDADQKKQVMTVLTEASRMLEGKKYLEFVNTYIRPSELEGLVAKFGSAEKAAAEVGKSERMPDLLARMQAALKLEPVFTNDRATFTFDKPVGGGSRIVLQKIGDRWYFRD